MAKVGVYICHCGLNIAQVIDVEKLTEFAEELDDVVVARHYEYMCSEPGQELIKKDIKEYGLTGVVVTACSPTMHSPTFQRACQEAGLNPYLFQMCNIREHVSWVTVGREQATEKSKALIRATVNRVRFHEPLRRPKVPVTQAVLVVRGGITGMEAALKLANAGKRGSISWRGSHR